MSSRQIPDIRPQRSETQPAEPSRRAPEGISSPTFYSFDSAQNQSPFSGLPPPCALRLLWLFGLLVCFALFITPAGAQGQSWSHVTGLPSQGVTALHAAPDVLWVGTLAGLARWDGQTLSAIELPLPYPHVTALLSQDEQLWVGTVGGLARWDGARWQAWQRDDGGLANPWVTALGLHDGTVMVGSYGGGVQQWDGRRWRALGDGSPLQITALASAGEALWVGTPRGLWRWDGENWAKARDGAVLSLLASDELWLGGEDALWRRDGTGEWVQLLEASVTAIAPDDLGITLATRSGDLRHITSEGRPKPLDAPRGLVSALASTGPGVAAGYLGEGLWLSGGTPGPGAPRLPVVLVAGLGERGPVEWTNLRFLATWLAADGFDVSLAPTDAALPLMDNVERLRTHIQETLARNGQPRLWLVAHSWGGLVASAYLASDPGTVAGLMTLGTPHAGLRLAYNQLVHKLSGVDPGALALLPEHQALLAPYLDAETGQRHVGGTLLPRGALFRGYPPHDGLISAGSATDAPGERRTAPLLHGWTVQSLSLGAESFLWPDTFYHNSIRPWLQSERPLPVVETVNLEVPPAGSTERLLWEGTLAPGARQRHLVPLTANPTTWFLDGDDIGMTLRTPDGATFEGEEPFLGEHLARLPWVDGLTEPLGLWATEGDAGLWEAELYNSSADPQPSRLTLVTPSENPIHPIQPAWTAPGESFTLWVRAWPGQRLDAALSDDPLPLVEVRPGLYGARLRAPGEPGYHAVRVRMGSRLRWSVVGVYHPWPADLRMESATPGGALELRLSGLPAGLPVAVGVELLDGAHVLDATLRGPLEGPDALIRLHAVPGQVDGVRWQLFTTDPALVPIGTTQRTPIESLP